MQYIVIDFEFNQYYDFENNKTAGIIPSCRFEIIQMGAVKLDENFNFKGKIDLPIKPNIYKEIHPYVQKITGITTQSFADKPDFIYSFNLFSEFVNLDEDTVFCVWGSSDLRALYRNLAHYNILDDALILKYIDIQKVATNFFKMNKNKAIGLEAAIKLFDINIPEGQNFHNALNDAIYTAEILKKLSHLVIPIKIFNSNNVPKK